MTWKYAIAARDASGLDRTAKFVYVAIGLRANRQGDAWPSIDKLAEDTESTYWTVRRALERLTQSGHLSVIHRPGTSAILHMTPAIHAESDRDPARGNREVKRIETSDAASAPRRAASQHHESTPATTLRGDEARYVTPPPGQAGGMHMERLGSLGYPDCAICEGTGWHDLDLPAGAVGPCQCRKETAR